VHLLGSHPPIPSYIRWIPSTIPIYPFDPITHQVQTQWLHELPIFMRINQTGADPKGWFLFDFTWCGQAAQSKVFPTAQALLAEWKKGNLPSCFDKVLYSIVVINQCTCSIHSLYTHCCFDQSTIDPASSGSLGNWDVPGLKVL
jgi:hypothetical protein